MRREGQREEIRPEETRAKQKKRDAIVLLCYDIVSEMEN